MTHLRNLMLEELERRNYSQSTARAYLMTIKDFARYFHQPPDTLGPEHIRQYQAYLFRERKLAANSVNQRVGALRFFFIKTLKKTWSVDETPYPKRVIRLPKIFSPEEVARLIDAATTPFYRTILMTLYATGVRRAELAHLKISDIDSQRMVIHVQGGKGRKDRDIMLSPKLLEALREHWRGLQRKPKVWLFPGNRWHTADYPITTKVAWHACREAATRAGLGHDIHPHMLHGHLRIAVTQSNTIDTTIHTQDLEAALRKAGANEVEVPAEWEGVNLRAAQGPEVTVEYGDDVRVQQMRPIELSIPAGFPLERFAEAVFRSLGVSMWESQALAQKYASDPSWLLDIPPNEVVHIQEVFLRTGTALVLEDRDDEGRALMSPWIVTVVRSTGQRIYTVSAADRQLALRVMESLP